MEADAYADSSFLVSTLRKDANHEAAMRYMAQATPTLAFTPLHRLEVIHALRVAAARGEMTHGELRTMLRQLDDDLDAGLLAVSPVEWPGVFRSADELSEKHAAKDGVRTLDVLHVAIALECGAKTFLSFDNRQRKLAKAAGLKVKP